MRKASLSTTEAPGVEMLPIPQDDIDVTGIASQEESIESKTNPIYSTKLVEYTASVSGDHIRWAWARSNIHNVHYNSTIQEWIEHDQGFANWIRTCIMFHADSGALETKCSIPDHWREDIGNHVTIVTSNAIPVRPGTTHQVKEGIFHVMN